MYDDLIRCFRRQIEIVLVLSCDEIRDVSLFSCSVSCSVSVGLARSKEAVRGRVSCSVSVGLARSKETVGGRYVIF